MKINCIAVDDEPLALSLITTFIEKTPFLNLVGTFASAIEALDEVDKRDVQLIFLDIEMPDLNGIEFSRLLMSSPRHALCKIIFITAYSQFAIKGYDVGALHYLLKPLRYIDFLAAASKVKDYFDERADLQMGASISQNGSQQSNTERYLFLKINYKLVRIDFDHIRYIESYKDYIKVYVLGSDDPLMSLTQLKSVLEKLPSNEFTRIHRSYLVANGRIDAISKSGVEIGGKYIPVGEQYREDFRKLVDKWH